MLAKTKTRKSTKSRTITYEELEKQARLALKTHTLEKLRQPLTKEHPANIAAVLDRLNHAQLHQVFELLLPEQAAKVLDELSTQATQQLLDRMPVEQIAALLNLMPMDEAAEILLEDVPGRKEELLAAMSQKEAADVRKLMQYPPMSAGHMMTEKFARVQPAMTVDETLRQLRETDREVETITDLYVLNPDDQLIGVVSLRDVVRAEPGRRLEEIMSSHLVSVTPETDQEEVARLVSHYDFLALPVVTPDRKMLGIIPVDDVIDVLVSEATEDILRFGGMEGGGAIDQPYFTIPLSVVVRKRIGWLLLLFLAETLTGSVLRLFESELARVVALSFFIPLLIGTGGNTGAQTVSTLIRGLALGEVQWRDIWRVIRREVLSGLMIGLLLGAVAFGRTMLWGNGINIALVVALTILAICTWANTIGALIPLIAYRLKIDPAVVSAPLITTLVDATGLAIYLLIAKVILGL
jgi:magnesium transporter